MSTLNLGFLASHGGSSMRAIVAAIASGELDGRARIVIGNNGDAPALQFAKQQAIPFRHISARTAGSEQAADTAIARALKDGGAEWVVMSGYLRKLGPATLEAYRGRIINIHPALLPKFGGQGMYGRNVHEAVIAAGETVSGATIHFVDEEYDHGAIIAQREVPVLPGDTVDDLQQRITQAEPAFFVEVLKSLAKS
ncbi:phosphoribosylglycinamide formyltransferase [Bradyrhizobium prioriisuperbiae]|uniref:phosphoribosylglycinamide formyltransferase n=1 Tax=Bradyrhizobium prioriisuperbiae TaxID=2854389 RepID=UPI0028E96690|nr:phosphoribosylglycinamide formyltransferase [Bradyrhizobium prioritasuperba]